MQIQSYGGRYEKPHVKKVDHLNSLTNHHITQHKLVSRSKALFTLKK